MDKYLENKLREEFNEQLHKIVLATSDLMSDKENKDKKMNLLLRLHNYKVLSKQIKKEHDFEYLAANSIFSSHKAYAYRYTISDDKL